MKKMQVLVLACLLAFAVAGCNNSGNNQIGAENAESDLNEDDRKFLIDAAQGGILEVELGKIAQLHCSNNRVREFGAMMVKDHGKANSELKALAVAKSFTLPSSPGKKHQKNFEKLKSKTGVEFDKDYMAMMVDDHKDNIKEFEEAAKDLKDSELKAWASKILPVLKTHQDSAKAIHRQTKVTLPAGTVSDGMETQSYP